MRRNKTPTSNDNLAKESVGEYRIIIPGLGQSLSRDSGLHFERRPRDGAASTLSDDSLREPSMWMLLVRCSQRVVDGPFDCIRPRLLSCRSMLIIKSILNRKGAGP